MTSCTGLFHFYFVRVHRVAGVRLPAGCAGEGLVDGAGGVGRLP
jgi:hypothetical protein